MNGEGRSSGHVYVDPLVGRVSQIVCFIIVSRLLPVEFYAARTCELLFGLQRTIKCPFPLIAALATLPYSLVAGPPAGSTVLTRVLHEWRMCGHFTLLLDGRDCRI